MSKYNYILIPNGLMTSVVSLCAIYDYIDKEFALFLILLLFSSSIICIFTHKGD